MSRINPDKDLWFLEGIQSKRFILGHEFRSVYDTLYGILYTPHNDPTLYGRKSKYSYLCVKNPDTGQFPIILFHRFVWMYFNGHIPYGMVINHIDGNKWNNHPTNLECVTVRENAQHAVRTGLANPILRTDPIFRQKMTDLQRGEKCRFSTLTDLQVTNARQRFADKSVTVSELAQELKVSRRSIKNCLTGKTYSHLNNPIDSAPSTYFISESERTAIKETAAMDPTLSYRWLAREFERDRGAIKNILNDK